MRRAWGLFILLACTAAVLAGCQRPASGHNYVVRAQHNYVVRAQVVELPNPGNGNLLHLHHEPIDNFVTRDGQTEGMDSMTMPFLVAPNVSLRDIHPGDKIEVILHVDWKAERSVQITGLRKLDPGLRLDFRAARPPAAGGTRHH
jgi:Cu/Ag efflux protein CusF